MNIKQILTKSWQTIWQYKALWILAMMVGLSTASAPLLLFARGDQPVLSNNTIRFTDQFIVYFPGDGLEIDLTDPAGMKLILENSPSGQDQVLVSDWVMQNYQTEARAILIGLACLILLHLSISLFVRYVSEVSLIRMVDEKERTSKSLTFKQGVRLGISARTWRLFLVDLMLAIGVSVVLALEIWFTVALFTTLGDGGLWTILAAAFGVAGMFMLTLMVFLIVGGLLSVVMPSVRRAIVISNLGLSAAFAMGFSLLKNNPRDIGVTWLIWITTRFGWGLVSSIVSILLTPLLLVFLLLGAFLSVVPGLVTALIASLFINWAAAIILGVIAGVPTLLVVTILPIMVVKGWVEIFKSSMWTYVYRELNAKEPLPKTIEQKEPVIKSSKIASEPAS